MDDFHSRQALKRRRTSMSSTLAISQETTTNADDVPDPQATDKHPQVTDEQLVIDATEELSRHSFPSTEQQSIISKQSSFELFDTRTFTYATPTFITEVLSLVTQVQLF